VVPEPKKRLKWSYLRSAADRLFSGRAVLLPVAILPPENLDAGSGFFCCGLDLLFCDFHESLAAQAGSSWPWHRC
jgi:hypothetical protein